MSYEDRLKEGAYTAPSGERAVFLYEDVSRSFDKKTNGFNFPDASGTYVQDSGVTGFKYPLTIFFSGPDCDTEAEAFENLLQETGIGRLEHPRYGVVDVVPFGTVTRTDAVKTETNQVKIELEFWQTNLLIYPLPKTDQLSAVFEAVSDVKDALGGNVLDSIDITDPSALARFKSKITDSLNKVQTALGKIKNLADMPGLLFGKIEGLISPGLEFINDVKTQLGDVVNSFFDLATLPDQIADSFKEKISGYKNLFKDLISFEGVFPSSEEYEAACTGVTVSLGGLIVDLVQSEFNTQGEALEAAKDLLEIFDDVAGWIEEKAQGLGRTDSNDVYQNTHKAVMAAASYLVQQSFTLKKERKLILNRSRTMIDLCAELYGEVDSVLDFFITSNDLSGSEILELPQGREILYYV